MKKTNFVADLSLYVALFQDLARWNSGLLDTIPLDLEWIRVMVKNRGISFCMIDMPDACRVFDHALSSGYLEARKLPESFGRIRDGHREFLSGLTREIFNHKGSLYADVDVNAIFFLRQVLNLAKKVRLDCSDATIIASTEAFRKIDDRLRVPSYSWNSDVLGYPERRVDLSDGYDAAFSSSAQLSLFGPESGLDPWPPSGVTRKYLEWTQRVADIVVSQFPEFDWRETAPKHGPGAVADARTGSDKYMFPAWPRKLDGVFPSTYFSQSREDLHFEAETVEVSGWEAPAKLLAVPKTLKAPRMIASEPVAHQYIQLGMMRWFRRNLPETLRSSISFLDQEPSRLLCLEASKRVTGGLHKMLATIDLSEASDRLSCWLVERIFRKNKTLLEGLHACRTRWLTNATGLGEPYFMILKKYAPMGNGTTFPVQSIVFAILALSAVTWDSGVRRPTAKLLQRVANTIRVFGDDIILPSSAVPSLASLLAYLQLKVNVAKTHHEGRFRESCGMDAFGGYDVTPVYLRDLSLETTTESLASWVDVSNNAYLKGLWCLSDAMIGKLPDEVRKLLPVFGKSLGCITLRTYMSGLSAWKTRYNARLHREEILGLTQVTRTERHRRDNHANLLQYFQEAPSAEIDYSDPNRTIPSDWTAGYDVGSRSLLKKRWVPVRE